MKKITIEIDDAYGQILTVTATGTSMAGLNVTSTVVNLDTTNQIKFDEKGKAWCGYEKT